MKSYKFNNKHTNNRFSINKSVEGQTLEQKIERIVTNKEPIKGETKLIYTDRKDGVKPSYNIRTDRWEIAIDAMQKTEKSYKARREERHKPKTDPNNPVDTTPTPDLPPKK